MYCFRRQDLFQCAGRLFVETKDAASEVEGLAITGQLPAESDRDGAFNHFPAFCRFNDSSFAKDAEVLGNVVLRDSEDIREFAHGHLLREQFTHDSPASLVRKRLQPWNATEFSDHGHSNP